MTIFINCFLRMILSGSMEKEPPKLSKKEIEDAEKFGGTESEEISEILLPSCDKGSHKERSRKDQPNHEKHWKHETPKTR